MPSIAADYVPARPSLRTLRRDRTRDEIAQAALELISRKGYGETLVDEIAAKALVSSRTFYRYFPAKEDAFFHGFPAFEQSLLAGRAESEDLHAALEAAGEAFCAAIEERADSVLPRLPHALAEPALLGQLTHRLYAAEGRLAKRLRGHIKPASERVWNAEVLAAALTATLLAALRRWQRSPRRKSLRNLVKHAMATLEPAIARLDNH